jgi:TrpR-related protein YerC/YecD
MPHVDWTKRGDAMNNKNKNTNRDDALYRAILLLETPEECYDFFMDLCTVSEMKAMEQRFQVAKLLDEGLIYNDILEKTGASSATISRVNRCLNYGADGYRTILHRMEEQES